MSGPEIGLHNITVKHFFHYKIKSGYRKNYHKNAACSGSNGVGSIKGINNKRVKKGKDKKQNNDDIKKCGFKMLAKKKFVEKDH